MTITSAGRLTWLTGGKHSLQCVDLWVSCLLDGRVIFQILLIDKQIHFPRRKQEQYHFRRTLSTKFTTSQRSVFISEAVTSTSFSLEVSDLDGPWGMVARHFVFEDWRGSADVCISTKSFSHTSASSSIKMQPISQHFTKVGPSGYDRGPRQSLD